MGMPGKGELYILAHYLTTPMMRIVGKEHLEAVLVHSLHRLSQVAAIGKWRLTGILHAHDGDGSHAMTHHMMGVHQLLPPQSLLIIEEQSVILAQGSERMVGGIFAIVMIAPDGVDAVIGMQLAQYLDVGLHLGGIIVHQVAREENQIWVLAIRLVHHLLHKVPALATLGIRAQVEIGELHQAVAVEIRRQVGRGKGNMLHLQSLPALDESEGKPSHKCQRRKKGEEPRHHEIEEDEHHLGHHRKQNRGEENADGKLMKETHLQSYLGKQKQRGRHPPQNG